MIYLPKRFENESTEQTIKLIRENPLATIISFDDGIPFVSHIPLLVDQVDGETILVGHMARGNPHWKIMKDSPVYLIFNGPNEYISPQWYAKNDVPTWNYAVVHIEGECTLIEERESIIDCLKQLSAASEKKLANQWEFWIPDDLSAPGVIEKSIVGLQIRVNSIKAKFKLNQSRSEADLNGVVKGLKERNTENAQKMAALMQAAWQEYNK